MCLRGHFVVGKPVFLKIPVPDGSEAHASGLSGETKHTIFKALLIFDSNVTVVLHDSPLIQAVYVLAFGGSAG